MRIEKCDKCENRYSVTEIGGGMPGTKESEDITCPHCGNTFTERSNINLVQVAKLSEREFFPSRTGNRSRPYYRYTDGAYKCKVERQARNHTTRAGPLNSAWLTR